MPFLPLFVSDYLSDPKLSLCSPATRGVWMDWLCVMHMNDRCGVITGTRDELARLGRCPSVSVPHVIAELKTTGAADVTERNSVVTLECRRMKRESDARRKGAERVRKCRGSPTVTPLQQTNPIGDGLDSGSPNSSEEGGGEKPKTPAPPPPEPLPPDPPTVVLEFLREKTGRKFEFIDVNLVPIARRLREVQGDVEGVKTMITRQCARWIGTDQEEFLRPETLFGKTKFHGYYAAREMPVKHSHGASAADHSGGF